MDKVQYNKSTKKFDVIEQKTESGYYPKTFETFVLEKKKNNLDNRIKLSELPDLFLEYFEFIGEKVNTHLLNKYFKDIINPIYKKARLDSCKVKNLDPLMMGFNTKLLHRPRLTLIYKNWGKDERDYN